MAILAFVAQGCVKPAVVPDDDVDLIELVQTPFYPQSRYQCGPAALATVLNHAGVDVGPVDLVGQVYAPSRRGTFQVEMLAATRRHGRLAYVIPPDLRS